MMELRIFFLLVKTSSECLSCVYPNNKQNYPRSSQKIEYLKYNFICLTICYILTGGQEELEVKYNTAEHTLSIRKPAISITEQWTISLL